MTRVRFTADNLGVFKEAMGVRFSEHVAHAGDEGVLVEDDRARGLPEGWQLVEIEQGFVPVHPSMIEVIA